MKRYNSNIKVKKAVCWKCKKPRYIYAKGLCEWCYRQNRYFAIKENNKKFYETRWGFETERQMFEYIAVRRPLVSFIDGSDLKWTKGKSFFFSIFAHVLPKGKFPYYRLNPNNIILLTPQQHQDFDQNKTKSQLLEENSNWQNVFDLYDELEKEYKAKY